MNELLEQAVVEVLQTSHVDVNAFWDALNNVDPDMIAIEHWCGKGWEMEGNIQPFISAFREVCSKETLEQLQDINDNGI